MSKTDSDKELNVRARVNLHGYRWKKVDRGEYSRESHVLVAQGVVGTACSVEQASAGWYVYVQGAYRSRTGSWGEFYASLEEAKRAAEGLLLRILGGGVA